MGLDAFSLHARCNGCADHRGALPHPLFKCSSVGTVSFDFGGIRRSRGKRTWQTGNLQQIA